VGRESRIWRGEGKEIKKDAEKGYKGELREVKNRRQGKSKEKKGIE
jgi:hypothetical protein